MKHKEIKYEPEGRKNPPPPSYPTLFPLSHDIRELRPNASRRKAPSDWKRREDGEGTEKERKKDTPEIAAIPLQEIYP